MAHLWSGRFEGAPDKGLFDFGSSFRFDRRLFEDDVTGSIAWAEGLERAGVLTNADALAIRAALEEILAHADDPESFDSEAAASDEDVHSFVERELVARVGDAGRRLHTGRSRNEQVALDLRLYLKRRIPLLQRAITGLVSALLDRAEAAGDALMPSYTHLRRAQPILVAHFFLAHIAALRRDHKRLAGVLDEVDELPLGSGAIAGTSYSIDVQFLASRLGFSRVVANSVDATGDRDFVASFLHACSLAMVHLSRICEDLILFTSEEFAFLDLADAAATGSSLMPQKKNPDPLELVRGKSGRVIGRLTGWLTTMKGLPIGYSKDLQEDKEALFEGEDTLRGSLEAVTAVVQGLEIRGDISGHAASGLLLATDVADYLVAKGVAFRDAHEIVGSLVRRLLREGRSFEALTPEEWRAHSDLFGPDVVDWVTPASSGASLAWMGAGIAGFELDFGYSPNFFERTEGDDDFEFGDSNLTTVMANITLGVPIGGQSGFGIRPYATGGVGIIRSSIDDVGDLFDVSSTDWGFNVGGGLMGFFSDNVGIRGDVRYFRSLQDIESDDEFDVSLGDLRFWRGSVGITFRF